VGATDLLEGGIGPLLRRAVGEVGEAEPIGTSSTDVTFPTPTSASNRSTSERVCCRSATAMFTAIVVLPTPPFGAKTLTTCPSPAIGDVDSASEAHAPDSVGADGPDG
jgi:hypothetical protein